MRIIKHLTIIWILVLIIISGAFATTFEEVKEKAMAGDREAQFLIGMAYVEGNGVSQDYTKALEWLTKAAEQDYSKAQISVATMYVKGMGTAKNIEKAILWFSKAAEQGDINGMLSLSVLYKEQNKNEKAFFWAQKAYDNKNPLGPFQLGTFYAKGIGVTKNETKAIRYFKEGAHNGDVKSMYALSVMYYKGIGTKKDKDKAFRLLKSAAINKGDKNSFNALVKFGEKGDILAQFYVAEVLEKYKYSDAFKWYMSAAEGGYAEAQYRVASILSEKGNHFDAFKWYKKAADNGLTYAAGVVASILINGENGIEKNVASGVQYLLVAAEKNYLAIGHTFLNVLRNDTLTKRDKQPILNWMLQKAQSGDAHIQRNLGEAYLQGYGFTKDRTTGIYWLTESALNGNWKAVRNLTNAYRDNDPMMEYAWWLMFSEWKSIVKERYANKIYRSKQKLSEVDIKNAEIKAAELIKERKKRHLQKHIK